MANTILHKRSDTASSTPPGSSLTLGELALNTADGKVFMKKGDNSVVEVGQIPSASEILTLVKTVDGTGSGLDADLLDGHDTLFFAPQSDTYTKLEVDNGFAVQSDTYTKNDVDSTFALQSATYTNTQTDTLFATKASTYTNTQTDTLFATKASTYTSAEVDSMHSAILSGIDWKEAVTNFSDLATTYPTAVEGWTASVNAEDTVYRHNGSSWVALANGTVPLATGSLDGKLSSSGFTKLSGIETGATADQTAAQILTLIKTVDGPGSGLNADLLDGYTQSDVAGNNTIVKRTSSGYIRANYFNTSAGATSSALTHLFAEIGSDGYIRKAPASLVRTFIGKVNDSNLLDGLNLHSSTSGQFNVVPKIQSNGVMEIGRYLDFHYAADSDNFDWRMELSGGSNGALYFTDDGETRRFEFHDNGEFRADGNVVAYYSDERLKENITPITGALDKISKWQAVHYNANDVAVEASNGAYDKDIKEIGLLAQEIQKDFPEVTHPAPFDSDDNGESISGENYLTLDYAKVTPVLVSALQDQIKINEDLKNMIADLQDQINNITGK